VFEAEKTRARLDQAKVSAAVSEWQNKLQSEVRGIENSVANTRGQLSRYQTQEEGAEKRFESEVKGLDHQIATGQKEVQERVDHEDKRVSSLLENELGGMDHLLNLVRTTKEQSGQSLMQMKDKVDEEVRQYTETGKARATELEQKIKQLEATANSLAKEFEEDSATSRRQLQHTQSRLSKVVNETQGQMDEYRSEIGNLRTRREREATSLHEQTAELKEQLSGQMSETVQQIEQMRAQTTQKFAQLSAEQTEYDKKLSAMVGMASNRDQELLQNMEAKIYELEQNNKRLLDWQDGFKTRTLTWRQEVERRIQQLQSGPSGAPAMQPSSLIQTAAGTAESSEVEHLRAMNAELLRENTRLVAEDKKMDARVQKIEQALLAQGRRV